MKIFIYLSGFCALLMAASSVLAPLPVEAAGCAGGKCGITTTLTPNSGPTGTQVVLSISSGAYPLDGKYEIWWSKTPTMTDDPTTVKLAEGWNERLQQEVTLTVSVPEATNGTNYFHYIKSGRTEQMMNFAFQVTPDVKIKDKEVTSRAKIEMTGSGFAPADSISLYIDGEALAASTEITTSDIGSFTAAVQLPDLAAGTHVIKATAEKLFNQEATTRFKTGPFIKVEPTRPLVGDKATVTGYGFAANSDVSIKYDSKVITASPISDKNGHFVYNFTVPETSETMHTITASDESGNTIVWELPVESTPPTTPTPVSPTSDRVGIIGAQTVTFSWMPATDDSGDVSYTLEVADNMNFFPLMPGMRRSNLDQPVAAMTIEPGTYYWRVQAMDSSGNKSKWALSPYAFQVGLVNLWVVIGASLVLLVIFIFLLRAFIQRIRGYYY